MGNLAILHLSTLPQIKCKSERSGFKFQALIICSVCVFPQSALLLDSILQQDTFQAVQMSSCLFYQVSYASTPHSIPKTTSIQLLFSIGRLSFLLFRFDGEGAGGEGGSRGRVQGIRMQLYKYHIQGI